MGIHVQSDTFIGKAIRWALTKMQKRLCELNNLPFDPEKLVWGNHDGIVIYRRSGWYIGEALAGGSVFTRLEKYEKDIAAGKCKVAFYYPKNAGINEGLSASAYWMLHVFGTPYDYFAYPRLMVKAFLFDWEHSSIPLFQWIGNKSAGWEWANWCTEGWSRAWLGCGLDPLQTNNPTPLTVEHRLGWLPQHPAEQITLDDRTNDVCSTTGD